MKKIISAFLLSIVFLFVFASCSGTGHSNSDEKGKLTLNIAMSDEAS